METKFCPKCGSKQEGNNFCSKCGNTLITEEPKKEQNNQKPDSRKPVKEKNEGLEKKKNKSKDKPSSPRKVPLILILILGLIYFTVTVFLMASTSSGPTGFVIIINAIPIILAFILFRYLKLLFEFGYFSLSILIVIGISDGGNPSFLGRNLPYIYLGVFIPYIFSYFSSKKSKGINKDIEKIEKRKRTKP